MIFPISDIEKIYLARFLNRRKSLFDKGLRKCITCTIYPCHTIVFISPYPARTYIVLSKRKAEISTGVSIILTCTMVHGHYTPIVVSPYIPTVYDLRPIGTLLATHRGA